MATATAFSASKATAFCNTSINSTRKADPSSAAPSCKRIVKNQKGAALETSFLPARPQLAAPCVARGQPSSRSSLIVAQQDGPSSHFTEDDAAFTNATIVECTEVRSGRDGFVIKMTDGRLVTCKHASTGGTQLPVSGPQPAMVLRLEDESGIMLPIIVLDQPVQNLMECLKNIPLTRPTAYQVMKDMVGIMGYEVKLVRITHRVCEAYYARAYLYKTNGDSESIMSLDMRPSDAINLAARAKVPIQVNKALAEGDGVVPIAKPAPGKRIFAVTEADRPAVEPCLEAEEFSLVRSIAVAAMLERYGEAARLRDELQQFRTLKTTIDKGIIEQATQSTQTLEQEQASVGSLGLSVVFPELHGWLSQCTEMAKRLTEALKNAGREEAIEDARRRFTLLLERS